MRQALGRGLDALIPTKSIDGNASPAGGNPIEKIPTNQIHPNRLQPRKVFDPEKLSGLAQSIKENGLAQPIVVSFDAAAKTYELIAGERRWRAAQLAGLTEIEAVVRNNLDDKHRLALTLIENLQREDLNPIEEALGYLRLMKEFSMTQAALCDSIGKSKSTVSNTLRLLSLPDEVQQALQEARITEGHARALLGVRDTVELINLFRLTLNRNFSVRDVEDYARRLQAGGKLSEKQNPIQQPTRQKTSDIQALETSLQQELGTKIDIRIGKNPYEGTVTVHFYSLSDFDKIVGKLKK